jgi:hypothetical protein
MRGFGGEIMIHHSCQLAELMFSKKACIKHHAEAYLEDPLQGGFLSMLQRKVFT